MKQFIAIVAFLLVLSSCSKEKEKGIVYKTYPDVVDLSQPLDRGIEIYVAWEYGDSTMFTVNKLSYIFNDYYVGREVERKR